MPPERDHVDDLAESIQPPDVRGEKSGRFEKHPTHAFVEKKLRELYKKVDLKELAIWQSEITEWNNGGSIILEFDEWKLAPVEIRDSESAERQGLLFMLAENPFPSIETIRMAINAIINLQEIKQWTDLSTRTKQSLINSLLKSIVASGSVSQETIHTKLIELLTPDVMAQDTLLPEPINVHTRLTMPAPQPRKKT